MTKQKVEVILDIGTFGHRDGTSAQNSLNDIWTLVPSLCPTVSKPVSKNDVPRNSIAVSRDITKDSLFDLCDWIAHLGHKFVWVAGFMRAHVIDVEHWAAPFTALGHFYSRDSKLMGEMIMKTKESQSYLLYNV